MAPHPPLSFSGPKSLVSVPMGSATKPKFLAIKAVSRVPFLCLSGTMLDFSTLMLTAMPSFFNAC